MAKLPRLSSDSTYGRALRGMKALKRDHQLGDSQASLVAKRKSDATSFGEGSDRQQAAGVCHAGWVARGDVSAAVRSAQTQIQRPASGPT